MYTFVCQIVGNAKGGRVPVHARGYADAAKQYARIFSDKVFEKFVTVEVQDPPRDAGASG